MIFNPFSGVPANKKSHVRGWAMVWAELLQQPIATKDSGLLGQDKLYLDHGVNFGGSMNLFGGVTGEIVDTLSELALFEGKLISLDIDMPNYAEQLEKRIGQATCHASLGWLLPRLKERFAQSTKLTMADLVLPHVTIGDSHSTAFSAPDSSVLRTNGATLYGALKNKSIQTQLDALGYAPERVTLVYGSIDIRHHIGRQSDPIRAVYDLAEDYAKCVRQIQSDYLCEVEVAAPVPVEHEGRKLPKTGYYNGTPFCGSREDRLRWTEIFVAALRDVHKLKVIQPPSAWYYMDPEEYAGTYMEMGGSVHIAPIHYRRYSDWNKHV